ncbi:MAG: hypothetical protein QM820_44025 [Minicystis sp.]
MKNNSFSMVSEGSQSNAPRKLQKPLRERELAPEQVVTYSDECDYGSTDPTYVSGE